MKRTKDGIIIVDEDFIKEALADTVLETELRTGIIPPWPIMQPDHPNYYQFMSGETYLGEDCMLHRKGDSEPKNKKWYSGKWDGLK